MLRIPLLALLLSPLPCICEDRVAEGWLGVYLADSETEARIAEVIPGSPAEAGGLRPGDVVVSVNGVATKTVEAFAEAVQGHEAGARVSLRLRRGDEELVVEVQLAPRPGELTQTPVQAFLGVAIVPADQGVLVNEVLVDSPAAAGGISPGDRIVRIRGEPVRSVGDVDRVMSRLAPGAEIAVNVENDAGSASLLIRLGARPKEQRNALAGPAAVPGPGAAEPGSGAVADLEGRLERAEQEVSRLGRELRALIELQGGIEELGRLREQLGELRLMLRELLARDR